MWVQSPPKDLSAVLQSFHSTAYCLVIHGPQARSLSSWERLSSFFCRQDARHTNMLKKQENQIKARVTLLTHMNYQGFCNHNLENYSFLQCRYPMFRPILIWSNQSKSSSESLGKCVNYHYSLGKICIARNVLQNSHPWKNFTQSNGIQPSLTNWSFAALIWERGRERERVLNASTSCGFKSKPRRVMEVMLHQLYPYL